MMLRKFYLAVSLLLLSHLTLADNMLMMRVPQKTGLVLEYVKSAIQDHGYSITHMQKCDSGMKVFGYKSDMYRVLFFAKGEETRQISAKHPGFAAYLPLKIAIVAERDETVVTVVNPLNFLPYFKNDVQMQTQFNRWHNDIQSIFSNVQKALDVQVVAQFGN